MVIESAAAVEAANLAVGKALDEMLTARAHWGMQRAFKAADEHVKPWLDDSLAFHELLRSLVGVHLAPAGNGILQSGLQVRRTSDMFDHSVQNEMNAAVRRTASVPDGWTAPARAAGSVDPATGQSR